MAARPALRTVHSIREPTAPMNANPNGMSGPSGTALWQQRLQRFSAGAVRAFHAYGTWLVSITWRRFIVLALALIIIVAIVHDSPPFTWTFVERVESSPPRVVVMPPLPPAPRAPRTEPTSKSKQIGDVQITIGKEGIRITPRPGAAASAAWSGALWATDGTACSDIGNSATSGIRRWNETAIGLAIPQHLGRRHRRSMHRADNLLFVEQRDQPPRLAPCTEILDIAAIAAAPRTQRGLAACILAKQSEHFGR